MGIVIKAENLASVKKGKWEKMTQDLGTNWKEIADLTGLTKESTIRVMKEFKTEAVIDEEDKEILILNEKVLQKYADLG